MIETCSLQSGSNGNSFYVETEDVKLVIDAGISARQAQTRLAQHGKDIRAIDAVLISHNHSDHVKSAGVFSRRFGAPVYATSGTWKACKNKMGAVGTVRLFEPGDRLDFGGTSVSTVPTPHDGKDGVAFVIDSRDRKLGVFTDLGHCFNGLDEQLAGLDGVYLESNFDPGMLEEGPYPLWLKSRIRGAGGHISNGEAAQLIKDCAKKLKLLILSHLSEHNNRPDLAMLTARDILGRDFPIALASREGVSNLYQLS